MELRWGWGMKVSLMAAAMVAALFVVPVPTTLQQGTRENVIQGFQGRYDHLSGQYYVRFTLTRGWEDMRLPQGFPQRWLTHRPSGEFWSTAPDDVAVLLWAHRVQPRQLCQALGTWDNVAEPGHPFPGRPVAFSASLLKKLSRLHWNPDVVGGPDIPPDLDFPVSGVLQIDTAPDNNRLVQLPPGAMPAPLKAMLVNERHDFAASGQRPSPLSRSRR